MIQHCVQCGRVKRIIAASRCEACANEWAKEDGIQKHVEIFVQGSVRTSSTTYSNYAEHCRECGGRLDPARSDRVKYGLRVGHECLTCDDCYSRKKYGPKPLPPDFNVNV